jgi:hypothetical protein
MDTNAQIISDLQNKIGFHQAVDFLSECKGVPVVIKGRIDEVRKESIVFKVEPPDSICMDWDDHALLLHDTFISGIQGRILKFDPTDGQVELGEFAYSDRGFGDRSMVRVEPEEPLPAELILGNTSLPCQVVDLSLNGFGILAQPAKGVELAKGQAVTLKLNLLNQGVEIPGTLLGVFPKDEIIRLAISFSQDAPGHAAVARYITRRRAEIRQEIQDIYQQALGKNV